MKRAFKPMTVMMSVFVLFFFFPILNDGVFAKSKKFTIAGKVKSKLKGVQIQIQSSKLKSPKTVKTNKKGAFVVKGLKKGTYILFPAKEGYNFNPAAKTVKLKKKKKVKVSFKRIKKASGDIIALHDADSESYRTDCTNSKCHKGILTEKTLSPKVKTAHQTMLNYVTSGNTTDEKCVYCHKDTDVLDHSAGNYRTNVSASLCSACHGPNGIGKQFYQK
ncbi:MAG: carboxypeptidase regulatory-like domain-containing protein [Candidatus Schekmanbacteria bacterium]|nr:MAG: carboxypeptidase regulatory-like domain-containing protein [Candidatus Schekmanbacteria bacterium]